MAPRHLGVAALALLLGCTRARDDRVPDASVTATAAEAYWSRTKRIEAVPVGASPARGPAGALVTLIEHSELACASCAAMDASLAAIRAKYGDAVRVVWKNRPLPSQRAAEPAAQAALEARREKGDAAFWEVHDRLVEHAGELEIDGGVDVDRLVAIAAAAGADPSEVRKAIATHAHARAIEDDVDLAEDFEIESVPTLFVNGRRLEGVQPAAKIERMIDEEIARARDLVAKGTAPESLYEALVANGARPWAPALRPVEGLPASDPALGASDAKVTVHVWGDYQCALCVAVERRIADLRSAHGGEVRVVWHDLPLPRHDGARLYAAAAREAFRQKGSAAFWKMHDRIVRAPSAPDAAALDVFAREAGLDGAKWRAALRPDASDPAIVADEAAAADLGITETPTFLVVPRGADEGELVGHVEYARKLRRVVEKALDRGERDRD